MKIIKNRSKLQESAQIVVSLGKSSKLATNLTNSQLPRPKSDPFREKNNAPDKDLFPVTWLDTFGQVPGKEISPRYPVRSSW